MDALAHGYGSSSDDTDEVSSTKNDKFDDKNSASALHLLASNYSDDESDDNYQTSKSNDNTLDKPSTCSGVNRNSKNKQNGNENDMIPPIKKRKPDQNVNEDTTLQSQLLIPKPRLYNPQNHNPFESLVLFPKDYLSALLKEKQQQNQPNTNNRNMRLETKLNNLYHQFYTIPNNSKNDDNHNDDHNMSTSSSSFATHLKNQKEFGNPHLFPSIIEHFGIDPLGSNCVMKLYSTSTDDDDDDKKKMENDNNENDIHGNKNGQTKTKNVSSTSLLFAKFEYVENIVQKEEENRIRQYNNK